MFRNFQIVKVSAVLSLTTFLLGMLFISQSPAQDFQKVPILFQASEVLPREMLSGPNYTIRETVRNDGFVNMYELDTQYGFLRVESTALLLKRMSELRALVKLEELKKTEVYMKALTQAAVSPVKTATGAIGHPVETVAGVTSGIGRSFSNIGSTIKNPSPHQPGVLKSVSGQASYKRELAYELGVDPYTTYEPLQKALNDIAWTGAAGGLTVKAAMMAIPGVAGTVVGVAGTVGTLKASVRDKTPASLAKINKESLRGMGVDEGLTDYFISSPSYDPEEQTLLVGALASMTGVKNRAIFVDTAATADEEPVTIFMRVRAQIMALYHEKYRSIDRFINANGVPLLLTKKGEIVGIFPFDHVAWTSVFAQKSMKVSTALQQIPGIKGKEFWITGTVDPVARKMLEERGWRVEDKVGDRFLK